MTSTADVAVEHVAGGLYLSDHEHARYLRASMAAGRNQPSVLSGSGELFGWYSNLRNRNPDLHNARSVLLLLPVCFARCAISVRQGPGLVVALV